MSRNFPLRTALTRTTSWPGIYGATTAGGCDAGCPCSAGFLCRGAAPLPPAVWALGAPECWIAGGIPKVDASRANQRDEGVVCPSFSRCCATVPNANKVSIPAVRQRSNATRARNLKKAARREFVIFMAEDFGRRATNRYLPVCEAQNGFVFARPSGCMFLRSLRQNRARPRITQHRVARRNCAVQRMPLSAVQFTLVIAPSTTD